MHTNHSTPYFAIIVSHLVLTSCASAVDEHEASEIPSSECQTDSNIWKCDGNTLSKCISGKWEIIQTCEDNSKCDAENRTCTPGALPECKNDAWKCDGNILSKCMSEKWEIIQTCENNSQCNTETRSCTLNDAPECTNDTWKCDGNILSKCVSGKWETNKTCEDSAKCNAEKRTCDVECKDTEHFFAERCEVDDVTHCGTHTNDCTKMSGVKNGSCIGKKCFAEDCEPGYHLNSIFDSDDKERTICEEDTHDACGSINRQCGTEEICTQGKCKTTCQPGEVICDGSCINPNTSTKFCGADASCSSYIPCSEFEDCIGGKCILTSCPNSEESLCTVNEQNICIDTHSTNINHCGACGAVCSDRETAKASGCNQGQCTYMCNDGMVNCGSDTKPMCLPDEQLNIDALHCGNCNTRCEANELCQEGQCVINTCTGNECLLNNACINLNDHCGSQCMNCNTANNASAGICQSGSCVITACVTGYHLTNNGVCVLDSASACPNGSATGTINCNTLDYTKTGICEEGKCKAIACQPNAHIKDNKCVENTTNSCGSEGNDCTLLAGWKTGTCENAKCVAQTCQSGFCVNTLDGQCSNAQTQTLCGTHGNACQSCNQKQICSTGSCVDKQCEGNVCDQTKTADETLVCINDNTHCGSNCQNCNTFTSRATTGICNNAGTCQVTACEAGFHIYNNACEENSTANCGTHGTQCNVANATNTCINGACTFTCDAGYHVYDSACEENSTANCGAHGTQCNVANATNACTNGTCTFACLGEYEKIDGECVLPNAFISVWNVTSDDLTVSFPTQENGGNLSIDWGDGTTYNHISSTTEFVSHTYSTPGEYTITVYGNINNWNCREVIQTSSTSWSYKSHCLPLIRVLSYGKTVFGNYTFYGAAQLTNLPTGTTPRFKNNEMRGVFNHAFAFNQDINFWDTSNVTDMHEMFEDAASFNQPLNNWDTSNVRDMQSMFVFATQFNQPLNNWDTSNVTNMTCMFSNATSFNKPINDWDTSNVTDMHEMFGYATSFNQPLNNWDTSNVTDMSYMFQKATRFNQPLNDWDTSNVRNMECMFSGATLFNQPLNDWDTSNVRNMHAMFGGATQFNQPLNDWDTSNVTNMLGTFYHATNFNQPLNNWNVSKVTSMDKMFTNSGLQKSNYCSLFTGPYRTVWNYFKSVLGKSFTCP